MKFSDFQGNEITLSDDSWKHIQEQHPEVTKEEIARALSDPEEVRRSNSTTNAELYYSLKSASTKVRYRCVVVKVLVEGRFVSSAMTTSSLKAGETIYKKAEENL